MKHSARTGGLPFEWGLLSEWGLPSKRDTVALPVYFKIIYHVDSMHGDVDVYSRVLVKFQIFLNLTHN